MALIKKVEFRGFKSLGAKTISLQLGEGLTAITGPNGSGKSNIFDAIIFCLGESSSKVLRVNKLPSLIYDGGQSETKPNSCRVTLTFENLERKIPVDSNTVSVARELRSNGENIYYLNGKRIQKNVLTEKLSIALIDPKGLQIVPQGVVTRTSELSPDDKRHLIEELVGVSQFEQRKNESMKLLQDADIKLQVATARIGEIKNRVSGLEKERNEQIRFKQLEDEIRWLRAAKTSKNLDKIKIDIVEKERILDESSQRIDELKTQLKTIEDEKSSIENDRSSLISNVVEGASGRQYEVHFSISKIRSEINQMKIDMTNTRKVIKSIEGVMPNKETILTEQEKAVQINLEQVVNQRKILHDSGLKNRSLKNFLKQMEKTKANLDRRLEIGIIKTSKINSQISRYTELSSNILHRIEYLNSKHEDSSKRLKDLEKKSTSFSTTLKELELNILNIKKLEDIELKSFENIGDDINSMGETRANLGVQVKQASLVIQKAHDEVIRHESQIKVAEKIAKDEVGIKKLEDLVETGAIDGVLGVMKKLISYEPQYEKSITAVGRRWMNAFIVEDIPAMINVIEVSKRLKVEGVSIIPESEISRSSKVECPSEESVISVVSDLITSKKGLEGVINFIFGDSILVDSTTAAYMVSASGFRAVTISGDVFEPKGMAFETGYVGTLDHIVRLIQNEESLIVVKQALDSLKKIIEKRKSSLIRLENNSRELENEKIQKSIKIERLRSDLSIANQFIVKHRRIRKTIDLQIGKTFQTIEKNKKQIDRLSLNHKSLQSKITEAYNKIKIFDLNSVENEIRTVSQQRTENIRESEFISSELLEIENKLSKYRGDLEHNLNPSISRLKLDLANSKKSLSDNNKFMIDGDNKINDLSIQLKELRNEEKTLLESSKRSKPLLDNYQSKLERLRGRESSLRASFISLQKQNNNESRHLDRMLEMEQRSFSELTMYGYNEPIEFFDEVEILLNHINLEYDKLKSDVNLLADKNYRDIFVGYKNLSLRRNQLDSERTAIVQFIEGIDSEKKRVFIDAFEKIDRELRSVFTKLTGGSAWLEIEDPDNIFSNGVFLMTQFPTKNSRESSAVSGGEKTVSALSLILAIQSVYPSPFYMFDEIDAHLDPINTERLSDLLRERSSNSQMLIVTLKDSVVSRASVIYGVYMRNGISQTIKYKPGIKMVVKND